MGDMADYYRKHEIDHEMFNSMNLLQPDDYKKPLTELLHRCKDGRIVDIRGISKEYPPMSDEHLLNCINYIKRRAKEGIKIMTGGGSTPEDFWMDLEYITGKKAKKHLKYKEYKKEAKRRGLI